MRRLAAVVLLLVAVAVVIAVSRRASGQAPESAFLVGGNNGNPEPRLAVAIRPREVPRQLDRRSSLPDAVLGRPVGD